MTGACQRDLVVLTADKNAQFAIRGLVSRQQALNIRAIQVDYYTHPEKDPGVLTRAHDFLRPFTKSHAHALVVLDRDGSGQERLDRTTLESQIESQMSGAGWGDRASAVVLDPELEIWVWSDSPHVAECLGWKDQPLTLREWLQQNELLREGSLKPDDPKKAMEMALRIARKPRSSAIYQKLANTVGLSRCQDPSFIKLRNILHSWFGS